LLTSLVTNLVDNAIKYSGAGCKIRVCCYRDEKSLVLAVDDSGAGLDAGEHEKVLGRFYRAADTNTRGAGLGLSIVNSIAQIHSAQVELGESDLGGLAIKIRFDLG
jgi:K+-sensing histidine kinase KdpD